MLSLCCACQGFLPKLLIEVRQAFPGSMLYTPKDHAARNASDWPSMAELVAEGRKAMVVSGADYGADAADILFTRPDVCGWQVHLLFSSAYRHQWIALKTARCTA